MTVKTKFDSVWFTDATGQWAMDEMIEAFLQTDTKVVSTGLPSEEWESRIDDNDPSFYEEFCGTHGTKISGDRIVLWCSCYSEIYFWDGPLESKDELWDGIQKRFRAFSKKHGPKIIKQIAAGMIKRGLSFGLDRGDFVKMIDEILVEGVMSS